MIKRLFLGSLLFVVCYVALVQFQIFVTNKNAAVPGAGVKQEDNPTHKVYSFSFAKYTPEGEKEIEIEGDSADIFASTVDLMNVVAKAYADETPVTITSDTGHYDKPGNKVHLRKNVVATTADGARLLSEELDIDPTQKTMETNVGVQVKKDNINVEGLGAAGDSQLKKVKFKKNVTVVIRSAGDEGSSDTSKGSPTVITCDGPLTIDYSKNIAHFTDNVVAEDERGKLMADVMDVFYNKMSRKVSKIVALGSVVIENPDGNQTFSDSVIYLAEEGRIILGGDTEALYYDGSAGGAEGGLI